MSDKNEYLLTDEEYNSKLEDIKFDAFAKASTSESPSIFILGGQPGAGKTKARNIAERKMSDKGHVTIDIDGYRDIHPHADDIWNKYGRDASIHTHADVGKWGDDVRDEAVSRRLNIILEGTMRTNSICKTIKHLKCLGYEINIIGMAVNKFESRLGIHQRYEDALDRKEIPRFVSKEFHDEAYEGMPKTMQQIYDEKLYDTLVICTRSGETIFSSHKEQHKNGVDVKSVIDKERNKSWSKEKYNDYVEASDNILRLLKSREREDKYIDDVKGLQSEAKSMVKEEVFAQLEKDTQAKLNVGKAQDHTIVVSQPAIKSLKDTGR